jgi:hypothetical protein
MSTVTRFGSGSGRSREELCQRPVFPTNVVRKPDSEGAREIARHVWLARDVAVQKGGDLLHEPIVLLDASLALGEARRVHHVVLQREMISRLFHQAQQES